MDKPGHDVVVVGGGPAGSVAAITLARAGARVALVDKASFPRDKACGDLVGPRALALLAELSLTPPPGREVGEMVVLGPTGRRVLLPARAGRTYPGHGLAVTRLGFDAWLREQALEAGADPYTGRVAGLVGPACVELGDGRRLEADFVIGADGATSTIAGAARLVDAGKSLWGFAYRGYASQHVERPVIALWDETPRRGFPGYGWIFPGADGAANVGLGIGMGSDRRSASRAVERFEAFCVHLRDHRLLTGEVRSRRLGGWLRMGMVGTVPARDRVFLVGDAAGLVNPLQGEGIAAAMMSASAAAQAIIADPATATRRYLEQLSAGPGRYAAATSPAHAAISATPRRVAFVGRALTAPGIGTVISAPWALLWNDLVDGAPEGINRTVVQATLAASRYLGRRSTIARDLDAALAPRSARPIG